MCVCQCRGVRESVPAAGMNFGIHYVQVPETGETGTQGQLLGVRAQLLERPTLNMWRHPSPPADLHPAQTGREAG